MRITEKQLLMLINVLKDSLIFDDEKFVNRFIFSQSVRHSLLREILNQQSDLLREIEE